MGIYNLNHFETLQEALKYYAEGMRDYSEKALACLEKDNPDFVEADRYVETANMFYKYYYAAVVSGKWL